MKASEIAKGVAWAAAGAALLGGGMIFGRLASLLPRTREQQDAGAPEEPARRDRIEPSAEIGRRLEALAASVTELEKRMETPAPVPAKLDQIDVISQRVEKLERRVDELLAEPAQLPPIDQVLAAVEQMISTRIGGLDERLSDQVHAIELLRTASTQTDTLLQRLIQAVEALTGPAAEPERETGKRETPPSTAERPRDWDYPIG
jgi:hypothetical protein